MDNSKHLITLSKALGLCGVQAAPQTLELILELNNFILSEGDISLNDIARIEEEVSNGYPQPKDDKRNS